MNRLLMFLIGVLPLFSYSEILTHDGPEKAQSREVAKPKDAALSNAEVAISFAGKGYAVGWDVGVIQALYQNISAVRNKPVVVTGDSSGSVLAAYMSCYEFNEASLKNLTDKITQFNKYLVNDHEKKTARVLLHRPTEYSLDPIKDVIEQLIPDEMEPGKPCKPRLPTLIVAANAEVLHTGKGPSGGMARNLLIRERKTIDDSFNVSAGPIRGGRQHLGKACTYFVDKTLFEKLQQIPYWERRCDLRLMETAADLRAAVYASVSEPTIFPWYPERDSTKLLTGSGMGTYQGRMYNGGYPMLIVGGEDIKRVMPDLYTISTGRPLLKGSENTILKRWYTLNANEIQTKEKWYNDAEISVPPYIWDDMVKNKGSMFPTKEEIDRGHRRAVEVMTTGQWGSFPNAAPRFQDLRSMPRGRGLTPLLDKDIKTDSEMWYSNRR